MKVLEQTTLPRILLYLYHHEKASRTDLKNNIKPGSQDAIYRALTILKKEGLIEENLPIGSSRRIDVYLSEKGKVLAEKLVEIEKALSS